MFVSCGIAMVQLDPISLPKQSLRPAWAREMGLAVANKVLYLRCSCHAQVEIIIINIYLAKEN